MTIVELLDYTSRAGVVFILIVILYGLHKKWWVPGWVHTDLEKRHERLREEAWGWRDAALRATDIATFLKREAERGGE